MKKTLILSVFSAIVLVTGLFAFTSASAQDYYDSYSGGFDSGYSGYDMGSAYDSYGSGYSGGYGFGYYC